MKKAGLLHIILYTLVAVCLWSCGAEKALRKAGLVKLVGSENVCSNIHLALQRAQEVSDALAAGK